MKPPFAIPLALLCSAAPLWAATYSAEVLIDSPVAFYRFEESAGAGVALDSSGNGNHATYSGSAPPTLEVAGLTSESGSAIELSGNAGDNSRVDIPNLFNPATTSWTVEAIFRTDGIGTTQTALQQRDSGGTGRTLMQINSAGLLTNFVGGSSKNADFTAVAEVITHAAFVFQRTGVSATGEGLGVWTWYANGVATASGNYLDPNGVEPSLGTFLVGISKRLNGSYFDGVVDEVAFYTSALPAARIAAHHDAITTPPLITSFTASPAGIPVGGSTLLSWTVQSSVTSLSIDQGVGNVLPITAGGAGSVNVSPAAGSTYTITASDGSEVHTVAVDVAVGSDGQFRINEFLAINAGPVIDEDGEEEDWIEILNTGASLENLEGWFLTDDPLNLSKWQFPETIMASGNYLLVFASGKDRAVAGAELHTNFKLSGAGEFLALVEPDGTTIHHQFTPGYPVQVTAVSYGSVPGGGSVGYFNNPTPLAENDGSAVAFFITDPVVADVSRGFFETPFNVTLTTAAAGAGIYYTTDASEPTPTNGTLYTAPIPITTTTTLRAGAYRPDEAPLKITTHTYIFLDDVLQQPANPPGYPRVWQPSVTADYAMDTSPQIGSLAQIKTALRALPTISLVMAIDDWFNNSSDPAVGGIYSNSTIARGSAWERKVSAEFFDFPHGQEIQVDAGMRIFGNASRATSRAKHNMRLVFRSSYGPSKLVFPVFGEDADPDTVNSLLLRGQNGDSWFHPSAGQRNEALYFRDQFARSLQIEMGQPATRQDHAHVYINGLYWGVFNTIERVEDDAMVEAFGGDELDWDVIKSQVSPGMVEVDGTTATWNTVVNMAAAGVIDPVDYAAIQGYLEFGNMIDWLLVNFYNGNRDWDHNNWQAGRLRKPGETFKFFTWDSERTLLGTGANSVTKNSAGRATAVHQALRSNPEYRLLFADRVHKHFFNNGALTPAGAAGTFNRWVDFLRVPLVAESARWGDAQRAGNPYTVSNNWQTEVNFQNNTYLPGRTATVLNQLIDQALYPNLEAAVFNQHGGDVLAGFDLEMTAPVGEIYYTLDGSDPRVGGVVGETTTYLGQGAPATAFVPVDASLGDTWQQVGFNDSTWLSGVTGIAYETNPGNYIPLNGLDVIGANTVNATVYVRVPFTIPNQAALDEIGVLTLNMKYDDGFVAYFNGVRVASENDPAILDWEAGARVGHPDASAVDFVPFPIDQAGIDALHVGTNMLAIHLLNNGRGSSDILAMPQLVAATSEAGQFSPTAQLYTAPIDLTNPVQPRARVFNNGQWSALTTAPFHVGTVPAAAANLAICELHYHPASGDNAEEYVELMNIGNSPIDLRGVEFGDGIEFEFAENASYELAALSPGERVVIVGRPVDFATLHGDLGASVAGMFRGDLENDGERIVLLAANGSTIREFTYNDKHPWPESADGDGYSLVLIAPLTDPDHDDPLSWRSSVDLDGSPAAGDAVPFAGDPNADGDMDGVNAFLEHALGTSDADPDSGMRAFSIASVGGVPRVSLQQNLAADDVVLSLETSPDLVNWSPSGATFALIARTNNGDGTATLVFEYAVPLLDRMFVRARASAR